MSIFCFMGNWETGIKNILFSVLDILMMALICNHSFKAKAGNTF